MASRNVCKFWNQGYCKFGDNCRNEHSRGGGGGRQDNNRFAPLNDSRGGHHSRSYGNDQRSFGGNPRDHSKQQAPDRGKEIDQKLMRMDLTIDLPVWLLSCYAPRSDLPRQLFEGADREQSPEEVRLRHYELAAQGKTQEAVREAEVMYEKAKNQIEDVLRDMYGAVKYLTAGYDEHPNRIDICNESVKSGVISSSSNTNGTQNSQPMTDTSNVTTAFGTNPTWGQPAASTTFGQPSGGNTFGQPSGATIFGQPSTISGFGQPSIKPAFGQPSGPSTFGQPSTLGTSSGFGQPSTLGQKPLFGQPSNNGPQVSASSTFGQPSSISTNKPAFGQPSGFGTTASTFGQPNNPFSQLKSNATTSFGQPSNAVQTDTMTDSSMAVSPAQGSFGATSSGFGQPNSAFNQPKATTNMGGFGQPSAFSGNTNQPSGGFGQSSTSTSGFGAPSQSGDIRSSIKSNSSVGNTTQGKINSWEGMAIQYVKDEPHYRVKDGKLQRIWFPNGPPTWVKPEALPSDLPYDTETEERYKFARENEHFKDGIVPVIPPMREWTDWNF